MLENPGVIGSTFADDIARGMLIHRARSLLLHILSTWPAGSSLDTAHCGGSPGLLFGLVRVGIYQLLDMKFHSLHRLAKSLLLVKMKRSSWKW